MRSLPSAPFRRHPPDNRLPATTFTSAVTSRTRELIPELWVPRIPVRSPSRACPRHPSAQTEAWVPRIPVRSPSRATPRHSPDNLHKLGPCRLCPPMPPCAVCAFQSSAMLPGPCTRPGPRVLPGQPGACRLAAVILGGPRRAPHSSPQARREITAFFAAQLPAR